MIEPTKEELRDCNNVWILNNAEAAIRYAFKICSAKMPGWVNYADRTPTAEDGFKNASDPCDDGFLLSFNKWGLTFCKWNEKPSDCSKWMRIPDYPVSVKEETEEEEFQKWLRYDCPVDGVLSIETARSLYHSARNFNTK